VDRPGTLRLSLLVSLGLAGCGGTTHSNAQAAHGGGATADVLADQIPERIGAFVVADLVATLLEMHQTWKYQEHIDCARSRSAGGSRSAMPRPSSGQLTTSYTKSLDLVTVCVPSEPAAVWQPTQMLSAGPALPTPSATTPLESCGAALSRGTRSYQYQFFPESLAAASFTSTA